MVRRGDRPPATAHLPSDQGRPHRGDSFGGPGARFGAPRGNHTHQGHADGEVPPDFAGSTFNSPLCPSQLLHVFLSPASLPPATTPSQSPDQTVRSIPRTFPSVPISACAASIRSRWWMPRKSSILISQLLLLGLLLVWLVGVEALGEEFAVVGGEAFAGG